MIDMRSWRTISVDVVDGVDLDPLNVRLEIPNDAPEPDIILDLFKNEKALDLVEAIVKVGYLTHEVPIVVKRGKRLVVVEGNRRLAALKAIQNPFLVPEYQARISSLVGSLDKKTRDSLRKIEIKQAPTQTDANQLIAALHTSNQRVGWSPARQAAFFEALIDAGQTLIELRTNYPTIEVEKYVLRSEILKRFQSVKYSTPELADFVRSRDFKVSTLARIYESKDFVDLVGLGLDSKGILTTSKVNAKVFAGIAELVVEGMQSGVYTTRSLNRVTSPAFKALMGELRAIVSGPAGTSDSTGMSSGASTGAKPGAAARSGTAASGSGSNAAAASTQAAAAPQGKKSGKPSGKPKKDVALDLSSTIVPGTFPPAVDRIFQELATLNIERHPNATLDLLRTTIEKAIKAFAEIKQEDIKKSGKNQQGYVYLKNCLEWLEDWVKAKGPKAQVQVVQKLQGSKINAVGYNASKNHLDAINHNHHIFATPDEVRDAWDAMQSLFSHVLFV